MSRVGEKKINRTQTRSLIETVPFLNDSGTNKEDDLNDCTSQKRSVCIIGDSNNLIPFQPDFPLSETN